MATNSPKKLPRIKPKTYTTCLLYNTDEANIKLKGLTLAACNPKYDRKQLDTTDSDTVKGEDIPDTVDLSQLTVSLKMSCNYCDVEFEHRLDQKRHYRSDWHRYNLKLRIRGKMGVSEELFEDISGNISSLSGSDSDDDAMSDIDQGSDNSLSKRRLMSASKKLEQSVSSTDSESEAGNQVEEAARRLPKVYFKNEGGELLSIYRCVICHKKNQPSTTDDLISITTKLPNEMNWAIFMAGGGHFAAAVFSKENLIVHKTFHRYVVRAKRGTAQSSRDSQGNAPKSGGASLRRYNEAALTEEIQELIHSWKEHIQNCHKIFLRAPSFNRKIFFGGKTPPFQKDDQRIRLIPFQTRRPTFNEVRRVYEMLASIECYGDEMDIQDFIPISPPQVFNRETGQLETRDETQLSPKHRKLLNKKLRPSPLVGENCQTSQDREEGTSENKSSLKSDGKKPFLPDHVLEDENQSSGTSTASETELVEMMQTISTLDLKEFGGTKKPKRKKKGGRKRGGLQKCQKEPESNIMEEEKYHLKNSLYTACKLGDLESLKSLLAVFLPNIGMVREQTGMEAQDDVTEVDTGVDESGTVNGAKSGDKLGDKTKKTGEHFSITVTQQSFICKVDDSPIEHSKVSSVQDGSSRGTTQTTDTADNTEDKTSELSEACVSVSNVCPVTESPDSETTPGGSKRSVCSDSVQDDRDTIPTESEESVSEALSPLKDCVTNDLSIDKQDSISAGNDHVTEDITKIDSTSLYKEKTDIVDDLGSSVETVTTDTTKDTVEFNPTPDTLKLTSTQPRQKLSGVMQSSERTDLSPVITAAILNEPFGDSGTTLLHVAAKEGHKDLLYLLMECGATPAVKDNGGQTPYVISKDKSVRNEFRKFMGNWPDKYDYMLAQIPAPLSEEQEAEKKKKESERKKVRQKEKKERLKVKKEEEDKKKAEEKERNRYLNLSDREKRALAADRRLVQQVSSQGGDQPVLSRCFTCAGDMTGKVPFEYSDFKFCSPKCLQVHRKSKTVKS